MKLTMQDKKDLDKYTKFLALKSVQIIIQSRIGEKTSTSCKPHTTGTDWFNLNIPDLPDVLAETKKVLNGEIISTYSPLCVEISLRTADGDQMVLETWCLSLLPEQCDNTQRIVPTVYNRMGILLKSLVSVTRVTPAYKLSRRQGPESYVLCYRIYLDQPQLHNLGDGYKQVRIGQICTPIGTLQLSVAYRMKMTISPTQTGKNNSIMVKSDHFNTNTNTRKNRNNDDISDLTKPMRAGPFADPKPKLTPLPQLPGVTRLLSMGKYKQRQSESESDESTIKIGDENESINSKPNINNNNVTSKLENKEEKEQQQKEQQEQTNKKIEDSRINEDQKDNSPTTSIKSSLSNSMLKSIDEEYWMKELSAPFATLGPVGELMQFYRQCKKKPQLQLPQKNPTAEEITEMLDMFESKLPEFDEIVHSFCESPDN